MSNGHAGEEHLRLGVQPDRAPKADVECVLMSPAKPQPAKEYDDGDEKCRADECKCADFCLCAHAPLSFL